MLFASGEKLLRVIQALKAGTALAHDAICHLFSDTGYKIIEVEIDESKNVGITTLIKNYLSLRGNEEKALEATGWIMIIINDVEFFDVKISLDMLLGITEDCRKIVVNAHYDLGLTRSITDMNAILQTEEAVTAKDKFKI